MNKSKLNLPLPLPLYRGIAAEGELAGKMIEGSALFSIIDGDESISIVPVNADDVNDIADILPETLGMYIGKEDMNGKNIFTGDVLACDDEYALVNWYKRTSSIGLFTSYNRRPSALGGFISAFEIIGNVHENPELLKLFPHLQEA